jgi:S1-C subfamily serine protease
VTEQDSGGPPPARRGGESRSVLLLMATTFTAAVGFVALAVLVGRAVDSGRVATISTVSGPLVTRVDAQLVDIDTDLYQDAGRAAGTGMVLSPNGVVLTNNHVIQGATSILATDIGNGRTYVARVVGYDERRDVAVLQLEGASRLATVTLGNSATIGTGERIVTIGNAGGVGGRPAARSGTVVGLNESITVGDSIDSSTEHLGGLIQVDGDLQPGDSGGPMVNGSGSVIGMDTAASTGYEFSQHATGEGFAIAIDTVRPLAAQIRARHGSASVHIGPTAFIGVQIDSGTGRRPGATVTGAQPGSPAAGAGLGYGDVITALGATPVRSSTDLTSALVRYRPGEAVSIHWVDSAGVAHSTTVTLATGPAG